MTSNNNNNNNNKNLEELKMKNLEKLKQLAANLEKEADEKEKKNAADEAELVEIEATMTRIKAARTRIAAADAKAADLEARRMKLVEEGTIIVPKAANKPVEEIPPVETPAPVAEDIKPVEEISEPVAEVPTVEEIPAEEPEGKFFSPDFDPGEEFSDTGDNILEGFGVQNPVVQESDAPSEDETSTPSLDGFEIPKENIAPEPAKVETVEETPAVPPIMTGGHSFFDVENISTKEYYIENVELVEDCDGKIIKQDEEFLLRQMEQKFSYMIISKKEVFGYSFVSFAADMAAFSLKSVLESVAKVVDNPAFIAYSVRISAEAIKTLSK